MLPPSLPPITDTDLEILDALRLERFRSRFGQILHCANLYISGLDRTLIISGGHEVGALRYRQLDLLQQTREVCGCTWVKVYQCNELIYDVCCNKLEVNGSGERDMATAIQEQVDIELESEKEHQTQLETQSCLEFQSTKSKIIRSLALTDIAEDLEAEAASLQTFLEEQNATLINFSGTILVPETSARLAYEHYSLVLARQKMHERFSLNSAEVESSNPQEKTKNNALKPKKNYLTWKREFKINKSSYKKTLQNALEALFPDASLQQSQALNDIIQQSDLGKGIVDKITRDPAYTDKTRAREQLLKAATELEGDKNSISGEEEKVETAA